jgi:hypothetical protein
MRGREFRRKQYRKHKRRWRGIYKNVFVVDMGERLVCIRAVTRRPCSCWACKRERYKRSEAKRMVG